MMDVGIEKNTPFVILTRLFPPKFQFNFFPSFRFITAQSLIASLTSSAPFSSDLEELQNILHFPEEVALRLTDAEYQLYYQVYGIRITIRIQKRRNICWGFAQCGE